MSNSIQSRLTLALTAAAIVLSAATGVILYHLIAAEMQRNFDRGLESKGQAVVSLVSLETGGVLDFEFNSAAMPEYHAGARADYFQIRYADGRDYARSESLGKNDLTFSPIVHQNVDHFFNLTLPDGRRGRGVQIEFVPQSETTTEKAAQPMVAVIARERRGLDQSQASLARMLILAGIALGVATAIVSRWIVRRSLRSLRQVALEAATIDAQRLDVRLTSARMPAELRPICDRLNDLLARLEAAFLRERRFTSDVAHELRTPIAELRAVTEVALTWPNDAQAAQEALRDTLEIATQMEMLVNTLLSLIRSSGAAPPLERIELGPLVEQLTAKMSFVELDRDLELRIPATAVVWAHPALLTSVLTNLFSNAIEYSSDRTVRCSARQEKSRWTLTIQNTATQLTPQDVQQMFEPFWRKDESRTGNTHCGLGLALAKAYCAVMRAQITAGLLDDHQLEVAITFPADDPRANLPLPGAPAAQAVGTAESV